MNNHELVELITRLVLERMNQPAVKKTGMALLTIVYGPIARVQQTLAMIPKFKEITDNLTIAFDQVDEAGKRALQDLGSGVDIVQVSGATSLQTLVSKAEAVIIPASTDLLLEINKLSQERMNSGGEQVDENRSTLKVLTEADLMRFRETESRCIKISPRCLITPLARDAANQLGITILIS